MAAEPHPTDPALARLASIVRGADTSRPDLTPQSAGLHALSLGLSKNFADDHGMLRHGMVMYDPLFAWCKSCQAESHRCHRAVEATALPRTPIDRSCRSRADRRRAVRCDHAEREAARYERAAADVPAAQAAMQQITAASLMAFGVWLHLRERRIHVHTHVPTEHAHPHYPDVHHRHTH